MNAIAFTREVLAVFDEPRRMSGDDGACGPSFEARKGAHLRMTASLLRRQLPQ
jgi:hypothetical protein